jgi:O-glycosyl hydrolase
MNIKRILILIALLLPLCIMAQNYGSYKLYASYDFEQGATDRQGNTSLELKNGASITTDAVRGKVLSFDRSNRGYAVMPAPIVGDTLSLSFWFKRSVNDSEGFWKQIFEFHNPADGSNIYLMPTYGFDNTKSGLVCDTRSFLQGIWVSMTGALINADDSWHHIVVVISKTDWHYYLDGTLASQKNIFGSLSVQNPTKLYFGMNPNRGDYPMTGSVDDVNVYHYPLSASQVAQLYKGQTVTDPVEDTPLTFHFDGTLDEEGKRVSLTGSGFSLQNDVERNQVAKVDAGGQLNFSADILPQSSSTINFLYKKEAYTAADNGKYIYQATNSSASGKSYGVKLKVDDTGAYLVLEAVSNSILKEAVGKQALVDGKWYALSIFHSISGTKGTMRLYQNGTQAAALAQVETYSLALDKWSLGSTTASASAGGYYDEFILEKSALSTTDINSYYVSNLVPVQVTVDYATTFQTIRNIGASDAWNSQLIGLNWPEAKKDKLAELLFSKDFDSNGNPKGIGLSCWRFNIGAGSAEQGANSKIASDAKRTECFLNSDLTTYNWDKQKGQQWFLKKAVKDYNVEDVVGFMNSPPVYYTKTGYAFNKGGGWNYILKEDKYDAYAKFTADVIQHFDSQGIHFKYISPVNEPQYEWNEGSDGTTSQEGSPATDQEIVNVVKAMSTEFASRNLTSQIFVAEAGSISSGVKQVTKFWGDSDPAMKIAGLPNVSNIVSSHSYWDDGDAKTMYDVRKNLRNVLDSTDTNLEFFQTEYSLLGGGYAWGHPGATNGSFKEIECAMSLARMLHVDFAVANATGWHWWTVFEQGSHGGESRFALIEALTKSDLTDGFYNDTKLLYTLGQYSRFVRPGMKRAGVTRSDNLTETDALKSQMFSAYINEGTKQVVVVATNSDVIKVALKISADNLPADIDPDLQFTPYVTDGTQNMKAQPKVKAGEIFTLPPLSVVTFVSESNSPSSVIENATTLDVKVYPNPVVDQVSISSNSHVSKVVLYDILGKEIQQQNGNGATSVQLGMSALPKGVYVLNVETEGGGVSRKIIKK